MSRARHCAVSDCKSNSHDKTKDIKFFKFPENFNDDWKRVVNKHEDWQPKKSSVICSVHFTKGDMAGNKLRPGAIPTPTRFDPVKTG